MFARIVTMPVPSGAADRAAALFQEHVVNRMDGIPGFLTAQLLWSDDNAMAIATYDSQEAMESDTAGLRERLGTAREIMAGPPSIAVYRIIAHGSR